MSVVIKEKGEDNSLLTTISSCVSLTDAELKIMENSVKQSTLCWTGYVDGRLSCVWGLISPTLLSERAYLWLFTTEVMKEHQFLFVRYSQLAMERMLEEYPVIVGHAQLGANRSIRWLRWLGAVFGEPQGQLIPFSIRQRNG